MPETRRSRRRAPPRARSEREAYRKQPTQARARATVDVILDAACRVLARTGYEALSTNRVAKLAGVSIGSLYQYFPGKRALVAAVLERHVQRITDELRHGGQPLDELSVRDRVHRLAEWMIESHRRDPQLHRVIVQELPRHGLNSRLIEVGFERAIERTAAHLQAHADEIAPRNHTLTAFIIIHTIESLTKAALARDPAMLDATLIEEITTLLVSYLQPDVVARGRAQDPPRSL